MKRITYIGHSGFMVETDDQILLFDCIANGIGRTSAGTAKAADSDLQSEAGMEENAMVSRGILPYLDPAKKLTVFISHMHEDHYVPEIWRLAGMHPDVVFFAGEEDLAEEAADYLDPQLMQGVYETEPDQTYELKGRMKVETLLSTDAGAAFYVTLEDGTTVFHAGDLLLWMWYDNSPEYNAWMEKTFYGELDRIRGRHTDIAFLPLDPRLEMNAELSIDAYLQAMDIDFALPMHFWKNYAFVKAFADSAGEKPWRSPVHVLTQENQEFEL